MYLNVNLKHTFIDVNEEDDDGYTAIHISSSLEMTKYLMEVGSQEISKGLHSAASKGNLDIIKYLVENNADIEIKNKTGQTPLIIASMNNQLDILDYLLERKADTETKDNDMMTALHWASKEGHLEIVKHLIEKGANIDETESNGFTTLHLAS